MKQNQKERRDRRQREKEERKIKKTIKRNEGRTDPHGSSQERKEKKNMGEREKLTGGNMVNFYYGCHE
jgi:hypothetical protein